MAVLRSLLFLALINVTAPVLKPFQRWNLCRKNAVQVLLMLLPVFLVGGDGKIRFGSEKMVKGALIDLSTLTHVVDANAAVAIVPNKPESYVQQLFFRVTCASHKLYLDAGLPVLKPTQC